MSEEGVRRVGKGFEWDNDDTTCDGLDLIPMYISEVIPRTGLLLIIHKQRAVFHRGIAVVYFIIMYSNMGASQTPQVRQLLVTLFQGFHMLNSTRNAEEHHPQLALIFITPRGRRKCGLPRNRKLIIKKSIHVSCVSHMVNYSGYG